LVPLHIKDGPNEVLLAIVTGVTYGLIDSLNTYGHNDVKTNGDGQLFFYLPASGLPGQETSELVFVTTIDGRTFRADYPRNNDHNNNNPLAKQ
jgi:hypothetical protein